MKLPDDLSLPFFAYGIFQPEELAFLQLKNYVADEPNRSVIKGTLRVRDGIPIVDPEGQEPIDGWLLTFGDKAKDAYDAIAAMEPKSQYIWATTRTEGEEVEVNYLAGKSPKKGSLPLNEILWEWPWKGRKDPLFTDALEVVQETLDLNSEKKFRSDPQNLKPLFRLEMAYLLLWTSIERYTALRYSLGPKPWERVKRIADEPAFMRALQEIVEPKSPPRTVNRADHPTKKATLDYNNPLESVVYYYQIRSNLVHRGKAVYDDYETLSLSLRELLSIFRCVLEAAFEESKWA